MKIKIFKIICLGMVLAGSLGASRILSNKIFSDTEKKFLNTQPNLKVYISRNDTFMIRNNGNSTLMKTRSKSRLLRQLSFMSRTDLISDISIYREDKRSPMSFFDDLIQDSTLIKEMNYEIQKDRIIVWIRLLEYPSNRLIFNIGL